MQQDTDLPIDINAINRQQTTNTQITTRFGEHLFTENSVRVNDALAAQIQRRQETGIYLFNTITTNETAPPHVQLLSTSQSMALFAAPSNFDHINIPEGETPLSSVVIIVTLALCVLLGFVLSVVWRSRKGRVEQ